ncbi:MAG: hypothetical protein ACXVIG_08500 [Halobacteriota archaeon]
MDTKFKGRQDGERMLMEESFRNRLQKRRIPLSRCKSHFIASDLRKFAEQHGDLVGWNEANRDYLSTHGVRGIAGSNYRHPLRKHVYDVHMRYWRDVSLR